MLTDAELAELAAATGGEFDRLFLTFTGSGSTGRLEGLPAGDP
jgi:hypothetical protein